MILQDFFACGMFVIMATITNRKLGERIRRLRLVAGLSQAEVADLVGIPRQSLGLIESGGRAVSGVEIAKIAALFSVSVHSILREEEQPVRRRFSGSIKVDFKPKKLRDLILYILARCGGKPNIGETVLYKLLYFIDFDAFEVKSEPITGLSYVKMQYGPVPLPKHYAPVIKKMTESRELRIIKQIYMGFAQKRYVALADPAPDAFSYEDLKLIDSVIDRLSDMTATKITEYVHEDRPWRESAMEQGIDYRLVFERSAPFARSDRELRWQDAGGIDAMKNLGKMSDTEVSYYEKL